MADKKTKDHILKDMNEAAARAAEDFQSLPEKTKILFASWVRKWCFAAGYERLLKILVNYPEKQEKPRRQHKRQLHFLFERIKLTKQRRLLQYFNEIKQYPILDKEEEYRLAKRIRVSNDEQALETFVCSNLRTVVTIAKRFRGDRLSLLDLINAGNAGLIIAAQRFDERKGVRFYWYASWWIRRAIYDALARDRSIAPKSRFAKTVQSQMSKFIIRYGHEPTNEELAQKLKVDVQKIESARAELISTYSLDAIYENLDADIPEGWENFCIDQQHYDFEHDNHLFSQGLDKLHVQKMRKEILEEALSKLDPREQEIIQKHYGLGDYAEHSLEEIARVMNLTRERIRQIRNDALEKLKQQFLRITKNR